ncbi:MAG TPA: cytochrome b [Sphingomicrobium sp.]|nr:cytochrome b [Sphingomicrobium sp.]
MSLRSWAKCYSEQGRFSPVGVAFHWTMAALIFFQIGLGWWMGIIPVGGGKLAALGVHSAAGLAIFLLALFRIVWRLMVPDPYNDADRMGWRTRFAYFVEHLFYVCFLILPLSGWAMWSSVAPAEPLEVGGIIPWPELPFGGLPMPARWLILDIAEDVHLAAVWLLMLLLPLHIGAALKHHFWDRNDVLSGMLPQISDVEHPRRAPKHRPPEPRPHGPSAAG